MGKRDRCQKISLDGSIGSMRVRYGKRMVFISRGKCYAIVLSGCQDMGSYCTARVTKKPVCSMSVPQLSASPVIGESIVVRPRYKRCPRSMSERKRVEFGFSQLYTETVRSPQASDYTATKPRVLGRQLDMLCSKSCAARSLKCRHRLRNTTSCLRRGSG